MRLLVFREFVEGRGEPFEAALDHFGISANANPEMFGHFEESPGDDFGFILFAEKLDEFIGPSSGKTREDDSAARRPDKFQIFAGLNWNFTMFILINH